MRYALILVLSVVLTVLAPIPQDLEWLVKPTSRLAKGAGFLSLRFVTAVTDPDLLTFVAFCLIGFLLTLNFILRFPDFGLIIEQYDLF